MGERAIIPYELTPLLNCSMLVFLRLFKSAVGRNNIEAKRLDFSQVDTEQFLLLIKLSPYKGFWDLFFLLDRRQTDKTDC